MMFKKLSILSIFILIASVASAQIYLRKETTETPAPLATAPQQVKPAPSRQKEEEPSETALINARDVANKCLNSQWERQPCLRAVSQNNLIMASEYADALGKAGKNQEAEFIKETCAASTAASKEEFPAYAMRSAFVECVNAIPSAANATGILPDQSQFQLLVAAIQCLDKTEACPAIEQSLAQYRN